jgi:hypothetical protein
MNIDIDQLTEPELIDLNHRIVERLRLMQQVRAHRAMLAFHIGDRVSFATDSTQTVEGTLVRYNRKTVTVIADDGRRWSVSPGLLRNAAPSNTNGNAKHVTPRQSSFPGVIIDD